MKTIKRALAMTIVAALVLGMCSMGVFAGDDDQNPSTDGNSSVLEDSNLEGGGGGDDKGDDDKGDDKDDGKASDGGQLVSGVSQISTADKPITTLPVTKVVKATSDVALPNTEFYVQMVPATDETDLNVTAAGTVQSDTNKTDTKIETGPALSDPYLTFSFGQENKAGKNGSVSETKEFNLSFAVPAGQTTAFTHTGIYRYVITEVIKNTAEDGTVSYSAVPSQDKESTHYITYDEGKYYVDLYVTQNDNKEYVVFATSVTKADLDTKPASITFTNKIECGNIIISKTVEGTEYTKDEEFTFYIMIPEEGDSITLEDGNKTGSTDGGSATDGTTPADGETTTSEESSTEQKSTGSGADSVQGQVYDADGKAVGSPITLVTNGKDKTVNTVAYGNVFTLKNGQYLMITAPVSMIFKVAELDYSDETYTTTVEYKEVGTYKKSKTRDLEEPSNIYTEPYTVDTTKVTTSAKAEGTATVVYGTTNTDKTSVSFTNTRNIAPTTGINLDFVPYVVVLALVLAAGGAVLVYKKKRTVR
jgi:hypothetical protein